MLPVRIRQNYTNRDAISSYLKDVNKIPLLKPEEEKRLGKLIKKGDKKAMDKLVISNLRFVISVAKQYQGHGLDLPDLINEGNLGLIAAAERYNVDKGYKFISYAVYWIKQSILLALAKQSRTIKVPTNKILNYTKVIKTIQEYEQKHERRPSNIEISELTNIPIDNIEKILAINNKIVSLTDPFNDDENCLVDVLPNKNSTNTDATLMEESTKFETEALLNNLPDREHDIIRMYFGLDCKQCTLEEIGRKFGMTSERIRQLKNLGLKKLKTLL